MRPIKEETPPPVPPELQAEFDEWEQASDEDMRKFEAGEYDCWQENGFSQKPGVVISSPDMAAIFPNSDSVNEALRTLVKAVRNAASNPPLPEP